jgi:hypothetical protein
VISKPRVVKPVDPPSRRNGEEETAANATGPDINEKCRRQAAFSPLVCADVAIEADNG